jgi:hypothetical protein
MPSLHPGETRRPETTERSARARRERPARAATRPTRHASPRELLDALVSGVGLAGAVPATLDVLERDPLTAAARFPGDLLRALMEVPGGFWAPHPRLYDRYRAALRAGASARRRLPAAERMAFWEPL